MPEIITLIGVFLIGIISSILGSLVGGASLLLIPFLIFIGLPPQVAIATDKFGSIGNALSAFYKFQKAKKIRWKYVPILAILSLAGSLIGANILLNIDPKILQNIVGFILLLLMPFIFLKKDIGVKDSKPTSFKIAVGLILYFLVQIFSGFFGGVGPIIFYILIITFGFTIIEANATQTIPILVLFISSLIIFALNGIINYEVGAVLLVSMAIGGYIGAHIAIKKGDKWVKGLFALLVIILSIKLLFF